MKTFEQRIKKIRFQKIPTGIILIVVAIISVIMGTVELLKKEEYIEFNKYNKTGRYGKISINYLTGPVVETTNEITQQKSKYYIAVADNDNMFIVKTGEETDLPLKNADGNNAEYTGVEVYGKIEGIVSGLGSNLINALNDSFESIEIDADTFFETFGLYYLDTIPAESTLYRNFYIFAVFCAILGTAYLYINKRIRNNVDKTLETLSSKGLLEDVIKDYDEDRIIVYKKLKVNLSDKYIYNLYNGFEVIALNDIADVYASKKMKNNNSGISRYIIIQTKDGVEHYIAPQRKKNKLIFNELLEKIKSEIKS